MKLTGLMVGMVLLAAGWAFGADNPAAAPESNFNKFFYAGGPLVWLVLLPLSLVTVSLSTQSLLAIRRGRLLPMAVLVRARALAIEGQFEALAGYLRQEGSMLARLLQVALTERTAGREVMENGVADYLEQDTTELLRRIEWLNIIGNVGPMIGLFGTVWGMIDTFSAIVQAGGQPEAPALAGGISVALVTTWWGLVVAIPALSVYGYLRNRIDALTAQAAVYAEEIIQAISDRTGQEGARP